MDQVKESTEILRKEKLLELEDLKTKIEIGALELKNLKEQLNNRFGDSIQLEYDWWREIKKFFIYYCIKNNIQKEIIAWK